MASTIDFINSADMGDSHICPRDASRVSVEGCYG